MQLFKKNNLIGYEIHQQEYMTLFTKSMSCGVYHLLGYMIDIEAPILELFITKNNLDYCITKIKDGFNFA